MNQLSSLIVYGLRNAYRFKPRSRKTTASKAKAALKLVFFLLIATFLAYGYFNLFGFIVDAIRASARLSYGMFTFNLSDVVFTFVMVINVALVVMFSFPIAFSTFFQSGDLEMQISMPISPANIVISKLIVVISSEYAFSLLIQAPFIAGFGLVQMAGVGWWVRAVLIFIAMPVIPMCIGSILCLFTAWLLGKFFTKDQIQTIFTVFIYGLLTVVAVVSQLAPTAAESFDPVLISRLVTDSQARVDLLTKWYVPLRFAIRSLSASSAISGLFNLAINLAMSAGAFAATVAFGKFFYLSAAKSGTNAFARRKTLGEAAFSKALERVSPISAIRKMDMRLITRTPIYFFNTYFTFLLVPLIYGVSGYSMIQNLGQAGAFSLVTEMGLLTNPVKQVILFCTMMFIHFFLCASCATTTTFSREGATNWLTRVIPARPSEQMIARCTYPLIVGLLFTGLLVGTGLYFLPLDTGRMVLFGVFAISCVFTVVVSGLFFDARRPKLNWDAPSRAVKSNFNVFLMMMYSIALISLTSVVYYNISFEAAVITGLGINIVLFGLFVWGFLHYYDTWLKSDRQ